MTQPTVSYDDEYLPNYVVSEGSTSSRSSMSEMLNPLGDDDDDLMNGEKPRVRPPSRKLHIWQFLFDFLKDPNGSDIAYFTREGQERMEFIIANKEGFSRLWGLHKRNSPMIWDNVQRSLRESYKKLRFLKTDNNKESGNFRYTLLPTQEVLNYFKMTKEQLQEHISRHCL